MSDQSVKLICKTVGAIACLCFAGYAWTQGWNDAGLLWAIAALFTLP